MIDRYEAAFLIALLSVIVFIVAVVATLPSKPLCDRERPTAAMILDCQATREAATAIAGDK